MIIVKAEKALIGDGGTVGHKRIVCRICSGPLQCLSLQSDRFHALRDEPEQLIEPTFLDLVLDDKRERAGEPALPPAERTSGNRAGVSRPQGASVQEAVS